MADPAAVFGVYHVCIVARSQAGWSNNIRESILT